MWHVWGRRGVYRVLVGKPEGKKPLRRARRRCKDNIKFYLKQHLLEGLHWIDLTQHIDR